MLQQAVQAVQEHPAVNGEQQQLQAQVQQLESQLAQAGSEADRLRQQLAASEGQLGMFERDKVD